MIDKIKRDDTEKIKIKRICNNVEVDISKFYNYFLTAINFREKIVWGMFFDNVFFGILSVILTIIHASFWNSFLIIILYIIMLVLIIYMGKKKWLKPEYLEEVNKLYGLYNYLKDYSDINKKEIKYVKLYEKFFLYAVGMGLEDKFENEFKQGSIDTDSISSIERNISK
jgi:uncharacterized membrane protein